jgi:hypothetical protein
MNMLSPLGNRMITYKQKTWYLFFPKTARDIIIFLGSLSPENKTYLPVDDFGSNTQTPILIDGVGLQKWRRLKALE